VEIKGQGDKENLVALSVDVTYSMSRREPPFLGLDDIPERDVRDGASISAVC
jgi:hypothetical protein